MDLLTLPADHLQKRRLVASLMFDWRWHPSFGRVEACLLALYTALLSFTVPYHEPWADEAQAWLIARDNSFWSIFHKRLHYEGSPPLWHFILRSLHLLHVPYTAVGWCGAAFAIAGIYVWLRWSPLPSLLRWLFPFTFFLLYQYAVVARSYVLFPLLLFGLCSLFRSSKPRPIAFAIVSGFLASLCMQGLIVSVVMTLLYGMEFWKQRTVSRARRYASFAIVLTFWTVCVYTAIPAPDVSFAVGDQVSSGPAHRMLVRLVGETPKNHPAPVPPDYTPAQVAAIRAAAVPPEPNWRQAPRHWLAWQMRAPQTRRKFGDGINGLLYPTLEIPSELFWPVATLNLVALLFFVALCYWIIKRRAIRYFLPIAALVLVGEFVWIADHHSGMLLITLFAGVWLAIKAPQARTRQTNKADRAFLLAAATIFLLQVGWSADAIAHDRQGSYDPSSETAQLLHSLPANTTIAAFHFWSTGLQPYFDRNPFSNLPSTWWQWSSNITVDAAHRETLAGHPDLVLYTYETPTPDSMRNQIVPLNQLTGYEPVDPILIDLREQHYRETHRFCGQRFDRWSAAYQVCDVIFVRAAGERRD